MGAAGYTVKKGVEKHEKTSPHSLLHRESSRIKYAFPIVAILVLLVGVLGALLVNTMGLRSTLRKNTVDYANDVSAQLASNISYRMEARETYVRNLADTFSGMPEFLLTEELLGRKAEYLEMEDLFVVNADGTTIPSDKEHAGLGQYLSDNPELYTEARIFCADHGEVFFSAPILRKDCEASLLVGCRSNAMLQQMLQNVDFKNQGLCCITDADGNVIVSATDELPFMELNDIFVGNTNKQDAEEAQRVLEDIGAHRSGMAKFGSVGGEPVLLGYDFLGINDWVLLTLVPSDLFGENTTPHLFRYIVIIGILSLVMLVILSSTAWYYRRILGHIQSIALTDPLTGGSNELAFRLGCEERLKEYPEQGYAIVYLNIQNFKRFNEYFGVNRGDELLRHICRLLGDSLEDGELLSRSSGDHFYLLLEGSDEEVVGQRLNRMMGQLERQLAEELSFDQVLFDQGAYLIRDRDADFMLLADRAKVASTYPRKNNECRFYDDALGRQMEREHMLDASFRRAIEDHEFQIYIQPKVRPGQPRASGGEVLVRWQHPEFGLLFPGDFIPLFERSGKICDLDFYMFEESCRLMKGWLEEGRAMKLSVNLSRAHLISSDLSFLERFRQIKEEYQIPDGQIELELTESLMLERRELPLVMGMIDRIREMGFLCSIDDFGFGYSSLTMLKDLNVTTVKLDRQFFLDESEKSWMVVGQLIQLAHSLDMTVVAEGIEEQEQVEKLRERGCDLVQGYVYAKPMPASEFQCWTVRP